MHLINRIQNQTCTNLKCLPSLAGPCILYGLLFYKQHIYSEAVISAVGQKTYGYRQGSDIIIIITTITRFLLLFMDHYLPQGMCLHSGNSGGCSNTRFSKKIKHYSLWGNYFNLSNNLGSLFLKSQLCSFMLMILRLMEQTEQYKIRKCKRGKAAYVLCGNLTSDLAKQ